jgi:hypothetical protein
MKGISRFLALLLVMTAPLGGAAPAWALEPLVSHFGLGTLLRPIQEPEGLPNVDQACKDHVYIFAVNGLNPLCSGNFNGLCNYLRRQGYEHTYFGQLYTPNFFACKIRRIRKKDLQARIVIIGFSWGCNYVQWLADMLNHSGTRVDLLVYLAGDELWNTRSTHPPNVCRVLNIRARGLILLGGDLFFNGADLDGARNCFVDARHILVPSRRQTVQLLMEELLALPCPSAPACPGGLAPSPAGQTDSVTSQALSHEVK